MSHAHFLGRLRRWERGRGGGRFGEGHSSKKGWGSIHPTFRAVAGVCVWWVGSSTVKSCPFRVNCIFTDPASPPRCVDAFEWVMAGTTTSTLAPSLSLVFAPSAPSANPAPRRAREATRARSRRMVCCVFGALLPLPSATKLGWGVSARV